MHFRDLESSGGAVTSGYRRPPLAIALSNGAWHEEFLSTPHKRTNLERFPSFKSCQDHHHPPSPKAREPSSFSNLKPDSTITTMTMSKLSRSTSSLSRSPTIKSNMGSLSNLSDAVRNYEMGSGGLARGDSSSGSNSSRSFERGFEKSFEKSFEKNVGGSADLVREASRNRAILMGDIEMGFSNNNSGSNNSTSHHHSSHHHSSHPHPQPHPHHSQQMQQQHERRAELQVLLPPLVLVTMPFVWWYVKGNPYARLAGFGVKEIAVWFYFDCLVLVVFFTALVVSARLAFPHFAIFFKSKGHNHPLCIMRAVLGQSWGSLSTSWLKPLAALLNDDHHNNQNQKQKRDALPGRASEKKNVPVTWTIGSGKVRKSQGEKDSKFRGGEGVQTYSNGDVYEGEFHQGRCSGSGVYYFYLSGRYEGEWVDGKYDGYGVETWARGSRYRGQYRRGLRDGYGIYRFFTGDVYSGEWSNGQSHGCGTQTCEDGSRYRGEFKWGVKHGFGFYHFRNGDTYAGEYFADKMHGYGVYQFGHGHRYEGSWHEGRKQGLGMYTFRNGETHAGHWHLGVLEKPSSQNPAPGSPTAVYHSKVLNAVQEARRAAAKAMDVTRVDDRVNKAVAQANRAANGARVAAVRAVQKRHGSPPFADFV